MYLRKYIRLVGECWLGISLMLVIGGFVAGCTVSLLASAKKITAFEALCTTDHGMVLLNRPGSTGYVCVRGVVLYEMEPEEHDRE